MIEIQADLHTHSDLSDGKGTLEENVEAAYRQGLGCIACTEHGPRHMKAGISMRQLSELRRRVDRLNQQYQGKLTVLMGLESNLISLEGELDVPEAYR
ncbi:MAG: PHP domain-containing protein, partial [Christensenellales bacterium]